MKKLLLIGMGALLILLSGFVTQPDATTFYNNGIANLKRKDYISAIGDFTNAISIKHDYAEAYYKRAIAKDKFAKEVGFENSELCFDLTSALKYGSKEAINMLKNNCMGECYNVQSAFFEPEIVFCADFSSQKQTSLPAKSSEMVNIIKLNFFNNKATSIPSSISELSTLIYLDMSSNYIKSVSPAIGTLSHLTELHLNKNEITDLPREMGKLKNLKELYLRKNKLSRLPEAIGNMEALEVLDLSFNQLTTLPTGVAALKNHLKTLVLVGNDFSKSEQSRIQKVLLPNTTIYFE